MAPNPSTIARRPNGNESEGRVVVADYAATLCADLAQMARHQGLDTLGFLLEMARLEAENLSRRSSGAH